MYIDDVLIVCVKLINRYMIECFLLDKVIDVLDEVGFWVYIINIYVLDKILEIEVKFEEVREEKNLVVKK